MRCSDNWKGAWKGKVWVVLGATALIAASGAVRAEVTEVRIADQFGVNFLPLMVMKAHKLIEKHAQSHGLGQLKVTWAQFSGGAAMNQALISRSLDFASGGVTPLLTVWDKTKANMDVHGVASIGSSSMYLVTINPNVKSIKDFTEKDRIALPAVQGSLQARVLQMAVSQVYGMENYTKLDELTVSMRHPDALVAVLSGTSGITAHFSNSPFQDQALEDPRVRRVLSSYDVIGGPATINSLYTAAKFRDANPKTYAAVLGALREAIGWINQDKKAAAKLYVEEARAKLSPEFVHKILSDPGYVVTTTPQGIMKYADFMYKVKAMKNLPFSWKDVYFPEIHGEPGN